ncbi:MAG TPA: ornithine carbamoyltransferase [Candidatus Acetothermia bacterium]|nr:ornithine carbamoyltransferase [Candidatus Acetothermia bacterium]
MKLLKRDLVTLADWSPGEIKEALELAKRLKGERRAGIPHDGVLRGRSLALLFQKPSLRTRVSFDVAMHELGGHAFYLGPDEVRLGVRETVEDAALVLSRYVHGIMARVFEHRIVEELARFATVPVINGLSDLYHPCQALGDMLTIWETKGRLEGITLTFVGDPNNVANSLMVAAAKLGLKFRLACPEGYAPREEVLARVGEAGGEVAVFHDPREAVREADVIYTDVWVSMGEEELAERKKKDFAGFTVDTELLSLAKPDVILMHCLPAHYGEELTYEAARSPHSVIFDQAENRLHAQKAVLALLLG